MISDEYQMKAAQMMQSAASEMTQAASNIQQAVQELKFLLADGYGGNGSCCLRNCETLARRRSHMTEQKPPDENILLRGLIQYNHNWKCTYGHKIESMAQCPQGFPGCGCADDLMVAEDETFKRILEERDALRLALLQERERCARKVEQNFHMFATPAAAKSLADTIRELPDPCDLTWAREMVRRFADVEKQLAAKQAKIDALMEEYCPDEMTEKQIANWAAHQRAATPDETAAIDAAKDGGA